MAVVRKRRSNGDLLDFEETRKAVESAESRARIQQRANGSKALRGNEREFARALHREADRLYLNGDYETALVLYHRASTVCPRESSHAVAARRTVATITSWNEMKARRDLTEPEVVTLCPELAAATAANMLKRSPTASTVSEVLRYFDHHRSYWKIAPTPRADRRSFKASQYQLISSADRIRRKLETEFNAGNVKSALKIVKELLCLSGRLRDPRRYQIEAYHYLALIHVTLGRHDNAVTSVSRMIYLAKYTDDVLFSRSLVTLGKVHLSFGHLDAAARAWEKLSSGLREPIPRAWIYHEIGRCYLETGKYKKALKAASDCLSFADLANSTKWMLHGRLLIGQSLIKLGRFGEALEELEISAKITEEEGDTPMLSSVKDLTERVRLTLRAAVPKDTFLKGEKGEEESQAFGFENSRITTVFVGKEDPECSVKSSEEDERNQDDTPMTSMSSSAERSNLTLEGEIGGASTFVSPRRVFPKEDTFVLSSSSEGEEERCDTGRSWVAREDLRIPLIEEDALISDGSESSITRDTNETYVIREKRAAGEGVEIPEIKSDEESNVRTFRTFTVKETASKPMVSSVASFHQEETLLNRDAKDDWLTHFEQLSKNLQDSTEEQEEKLLKMIQELLSVSDEATRCLGDSKSSRRSLEAKENEETSEMDDRTKAGSTTSRSNEASRGRASESITGGKIYGGATAHSLYRHSLPSSPRKRESEEVSYTCEGGSNVLGTKGNV